MANILKILSLILLKFYILQGVFQYIFYAVQKCHVIKCSNQKVMELNFTNAQSEGQFLVEKLFYKSKCPSVCPSVRQPRLGP